MKKEDEIGPKYLVVERETMRLTRGPTLINSTIYDTKLSDKTIYM